MASRRTPPSSNHLCPFPSLLDTRPTSPPQPKPPPAAQRTQNRSCPRVSGIRYQSRSAEWLVLPNAAEGCTVEVPREKKAKGNRTGGEGAEGMRGGETHEDRNGELQERK
ncbi:hypothetical protein MMC30_005185 [Trapelia coarctata]|nr:hypothetical protein [Trapelia coarctata]